MLEAAIQGLGDLLQLQVLAFMVVGVLIALFIGIVPGMGSAAMFSILIPFTFAVEPMMAFALVAGFIAVGNTSDSIPAILMGIPGSSSSQATIIDGYAMTKNGEAARALGASFTASLLGGIFGVVVLSLAIPILRPLVLVFGAPEFLMLSVWGLSMVGILSGKSTFKGLAVGAIGLLLGSVGLDPNHGYPRWTLGSAYMLEGIPLALIGLSLFAVPELISLVVKRTRIASEADNVAQDLGSLSGQLRGARDVLRYPGVFLRTSGLGVLVGAIPGIGSSVVDWLAYGLTVQTSKDKSRFGKGDVRSVIGIDGATNATTGGSLIPALAFGIPGGLASAFLLVVLGTHGVQVGSQMFTNTGNLSLVYFLIWGVAIANIVGSTLCFFGAGFFSRIALVPHYYIFAIFIPVICFAAYYTKNNYFFLYLLLAFGILGYVFKTLGWPRPPLLIGLVLSKPIEANLGISLNIFGMSWLFRPIVLVILVAIIAGLIFPILSNRKQRLAAAKAEGASKRGAFGLPKPRLTMVGATDIGFTLLLLGILAWGLIDTGRWPARATTFPIVTGITLVILLIGVLLTKLFSRSGHEAAADTNMAAGSNIVDLPPDVLDTPGLVLRRSSVAFLWIAALVLGGILFGFAAALPSFTLVYLRGSARVGWIPSLITFGGVALGLYLFGEIAGIYWNTGLILRVLGM